MVENQSNTSANGGIVAKVEVRPCKLKGKTDRARSINIVG